MTEETKVKREYSNIVFVGNKPFMNYVTSVAMAFTTQNTNEAIIKARGKLISRAVDVAMVAMKRFLDNAVEVSDVKIGDETCKNKDNKEIKVSFIEITLKKKA